MDLGSPHDPAPLSPRGVRRTRVLRLAPVGGAVAALVILVAAGAVALHTLLDRPSTGSSVAVGAVDASMLSPDLTATWSGPSTPSTTSVTTAPTTSTPAPPPTSAVLRSVTARSAAAAPASPRVVTPPPPTPVATTPVRTVPPTLAPPTTPPTPTPTRTRTPPRGGGPRLGQRCASHGAIRLVEGRVAICTTTRADPVDRWRPL